MEEAKVGRRRQGRRANLTTGAREKVVRIRLSDQEYSEVESMAAAMRCSIPRVFTSAVESGGEVFGRVQAVRMNGLAAELYATNRMLAGIGNNLNQLARSANIDAAVDAEKLSACIAELGQTLVDVKRVVDGAWPE